MSSSSMYVAMLCKVQKMQSALISELHLDSNLLAKLNERDLLKSEEYGVINAHIVRNNICAVGTYFVNSVLLPRSILYIYVDLARFGVISSDYCHTS